MMEATFNVKLSSTSLVSKLLNFPDITINARNNRNFMVLSDSSFQLIILNETLNKLGNTENIIKYSTGWCEKVNIEIKKLFIQFMCSINLNDQGLFKNDVMVVF